MIEFCVKIGGCTCLLAYLVILALLGISQLNSIFSMKHELDSIDLENVYDIKENWESPFIFDLKVVKLGQNCDNNHKSHYKRSKWIEIFNQDSCKVQVK